MNKNKQIAAKRAAADQPGKPPRKLTPKMEAYCLEYLVDFNGTQAAIRAGYSTRSAKDIAKEMMCDPIISERIQSLVAERSRRTEVTADRVLQEVARVGLSDVRKLFKQDGTPIPVCELGDDVAAAIASVKVLDVYEGTGKDRRFIGQTIEYKLWDKNSAAEKLMKHMGMFEKDNKQAADPLVQLLAALSGKVVAPTNTQDEAVEPNDD